jgi:hypothetical protein
LSGDIGDLVIDGGLDIWGEDSALACSEVEGYIEDLLHLVEGVSFIRHAFCQLGNDLLFCYGGVG